MDNAASLDRPEAEAEVSVKRPLDVENGAAEDVLPSAKKTRVGGVAEDVRKVAEIVLVLAAMGEMRGGRKPTPTEVEMMDLARGKLADVCKEFAPKDIFPRDAFGAVIEDLGLNRLKEQQRLGGVRPPKISIAEKIKIAKQKMEKSAEFTLRSISNSSQRLQTNVGGAAENRGMPHAVRMVPSDKASHPPTSGSFQQPSTLAHASPASARPLPYQLPTSEVRPIPSNVPGSHLGRESSALPRVERPQFRLDARSNGASYPSQSQANSVGDHNMSKTPTWSMQTQTTSLAKVGSDKVPANVSFKAEGSHTSTSRMTSQVMPSRPSNAQTASGNPPLMHHHLHGTNFIQTPVAADNHNAISKIVQKLLQPQLPEHPTWTPPSRDYMAKALTCQICKVTINEVETALVCDACESGFHLRCLQCNAKTIPRGEWHCAKCLAVSNGKPLPPKYGRVMRNIGAPKMTSNATTVVQSSFEKKVQLLDENHNQQKITENGDAGLQRVTGGTTVTNNLHSPQTIRSPESGEVPGSEAHKGKVDDKVPSESCPNNSVKKSGEEQQVTGSKSEPIANSESVMVDHSQTLGNHQYGNQIKILNTADAQSNQSREDNLASKGSEKSYNRDTADSNQNVEIKKDQEEFQQANPIKTIGNSTSVIDDRSSSTRMRDVKWIGDIFNVIDDKTYYQSCCINGVVYKVQDHAVFSSNGNKYMPNKLQAMWEDNKTGSKWVTVTRCYFPNDLPEGVGRPCSPESNEVYESNHENTLMAGLIHAPCEVLPPNKFFEESGRRSHSGTGESDGRRPLYLCKWFYDETKALFRDVTC